MAGASYTTLPQVTENFMSCGIPFPHLLRPFVSGVEFFGGLFLLPGILTRLSAGALGITMMVAIGSAKWADVDSLETLRGFEVDHRASARALRVCQRRSSANGSSPYRNYHGSTEGWLGTTGNLGEMPCVV